MNPQVCSRVRISAASVRSPLPMELITWAMTACCASRGSRSTNPRVTITDASFIVSPAAPTFAAEVSIRSTRGGGTAAATATSWTRLASRCSARSRGLGGRVSIRRSTPPTPVRRNVSRTMAQSTSVSTRPGRMKSPASHSHGKSASDRRTAAHMAGSRLNTRSSHAERPAGSSTMRSATRNTTAATATSSGEIMMERGMTEIVRTTTTIAAESAPVRRCRRCSSRKWTRGG